MKTIKTYFPIILIFSYLIALVILFQIKNGSFSWMQMMNEFMGGFFLIFSFFKLLNLRGFADAYQGYDLVAKNLPLYGYLYPFIEIILGLSYFLGYFPLTTNIITFVVMSVSTVGVIQSLRKKTEIQCACLGTVLNLPMSKITLLEDLLMVVMSAIMIGVSVWGLD